MTEFTDHMADVAERLKVAERKETERWHARKANRLRNLARAAAEREAAAKEAGITVEQLTARRRREYDSHQRVRADIAEVNHGPAVSTPFALILKK